MRRGTLIIAFGLLAAGCTSHSRNGGTTAAEPTALLAAYRAAPSSALAFDPPVSTTQPPLDLNRDARLPAAFVGYDQGIATFYYVRTDDRDFSGFGHNHLQYERRAISTKIGVSYR
jgi:hypothetical protein